MALSDIFKPARRDAEPQVFESEPPEERPEAPPAPTLVEVPPARPSTPEIIAAWFNEMKDLAPPASQRNQLEWLDEQFPILWERLE